MSTFTPFPYRINLSTMSLIYQLCFILDDLKNYCKSEELEYEKNLNT